MSQIVQSRDAANPLAVFQETAIHRTWHQEEHVGCGEGQTAILPPRPIATMRLASHPTLAGGRIAKKARLDLANKTAKRGVSGENYLMPGKQKWGQK